MTRFYLSFLLIFILSCTADHEGLVANMYELESATQEESFCEFQPRIIGVEIWNNSSNPFFIPNVGSGKITFFDYVPIMENYGSPQEDAQTRKENFDHFLTTNSIDQERDEFKITLPVFYQRYQTDFKGDTIDLFHFINELDNVYQTGKLSCIYDDFQLPTPTKNLSSGLPDTSWLEPGEVEILMYDVTPLFLRKGKYEFEFVLKPDSSTAPVLKNNIKFLPYMEKIKSTILILE